MNVITFYAYIRRDLSVCHPAILNDDWEYLLSLRIFILSIVTQNLLHIFTIVITKICRYKAPVVTKTKIDKQNNVSIQFVTLTMLTREIDNTFCY